MLYSLSDLVKERRSQTSNSKCDATKHIQGTPFEWRSLVFPTIFFDLSPYMTFQHRLSHLLANRIMAYEQKKKYFFENKHYSAPSLR